MTERRGGSPNARVLLVDTDPDSQRLAALSNAGFVVHRTDDVRAVRAAHARCKPDVVVHIATHFVPSARSAFETTLSQVCCPVIAIDDHEDRGLDLVRAGAADLVLIDRAGVYLSQLIQRVRVVVARRGPTGGDGELPEHIARLVENMPCGALLAESDGRVVVANRAAEHAIGLAAGAEGPWYANLELSPDLVARMHASGSLDLTSAARRADKKRKCRVELHARRIRGAGSTGERWLVVTRDLGPEELAARKELESERARRLVEYGGDMLLLHDTEGIDLDRFKPVNDRHGHHAGDLLLKQAAERLVACGRRSDTVARLGGDEFAMILTDLDRIDLAEQVPRRVLDALRRPFDLDGIAVEVSGSIGVTYYPDHSRNMDQLLRFADAAMYKAKESRSNYKVFDVSLTATSA